MDSIPLVNEQIAAGKQFLEEFGKTFPIVAAFWLKDRDESEWRLHVAPQQIADQDRQKAYGEIVRIAGALKGGCLGIMDIKLRKPDERIVQFALDFQRRYRAPLPTIFNVPSFEGVDVEGMYLYPPLTAAAA